MRTDKIYGIGLEIETFCNIFKIKIILYNRYITDKKLLKTDKDRVDITLYLEVNMKVILH